MEKPVAIRQGSNAAKQKRSLFAFDLSKAWALALREVAEKHYPDEQSATALVRHIVQDFVGCFFPEQEMKQRGLLASYRTASPPELLLSAIRHAEKRSRELPKKTR